MCSSSIGRIPASPTASPASNFGPTETELSSSSTIAAFTRNDYGAIIRHAVAGTLALLGEYNIRYIFYGPHSLRGWSRKYLPGEPDSVARFELRPDGDGTLLVLDHRGLPPAAIAGYGAGWHSHLDSLESHLTGGEADWSARFEELGPAYERKAAAVSG